jgi:hypothetical protein
MLALRVLLFSCVAINLICQIVFRDINRKFKFSFIKTLFPRKIKIDQKLANSGSLSLEKQEELIKRNKLAIMVYWISLVIGLISIILVLKVK